MTGAPAACESGRPWTRAPTSSASASPAARLDKVVRRRRGGFCYELRSGSDAWRAQCRFTLRPYALEDFTAACRWQETESPFLAGHRVCSIAIPDGRVTLMDDRLIVNSEEGREERLVGEDEVTDLLAELFGIEPEAATRP